MEPVFEVSSQSLQVVIPQNERLCNWDESFEKEVIDALPKSYSLLQKMWGKVAPWSPKQLYLIELRRGGDISNILGRAQGEAETPIGFLELSQKNIETESRQDPDVVLKTIAHELSHAWFSPYTGSFPFTLNESLAELPKFILERSGKQPYDYNDYRDATLQDTADLRECSVSSFDQTHPSLGKVGLRLIAGTRLWEYLQTDPNIFKNIRQKEIESYQNNQNAPILEQWLDIAESVSPGFNSWYNNQNIFHMLP